MWLSKKHIEERLDQKNLREITTKYHAGHRKYRYGLLDEPQKQPHRTFIYKELAAKVIIDYRTTAAHRFRAVCFAHDAAFSDSKDLAKKTISDIVLKEKNHEIARYRKI